MEKNVCLNLEKALNTKYVGRCVKVNQINSQWITDCTGFTRRPRYQYDLIHQKYVSNQDLFILLILFGLLFDIFVVRFTY